MSREDLQPTPDNARIPTDLPVRSFESLIASLSGGIAEARSLARLPILTLPLVVFDSETTGLDPFDQDHRIIELAFKRTDPDGKVREYKTLINPQRSIPMNITEITGITEDEMRDAPVFAYIADEVADFLRGAIVVAHNATFDLNFLVAEFQRMGRALPIQPVVDTVLLARRCFNFRNVETGKKDNRLGNVARSLGISPRVDAHRAYADVDITDQIFQAMVAHLQRLIERPITARDLHNHMGTELLTIAPILQGRELRILPSMENLQTVFQSAITLGKVVSFLYRKGRGGDTELRVITPTKILHDRVIGNDSARAGAEREFVFGRIVEIVVS